MALYVSTWTRRPILSPVCILKQTLKRFIDKTCLAYFIVFHLAASAACHDVTSVLLKHIERLDAKIEEMEARHRVEIRNLGDKMTQQEEIYKLGIVGLDKRLFK